MKCKLLTTFDIMAPIQTGFIKFRFGEGNCSPQHPPPLGAHKVMFDYLILFEYFDYDTRK